MKYWTYNIWNGSLRFDKIHYVGKHVMWPSHLNGNLEQMNR